jgi:TrkA-N domain/RyR domain
MIGVRPVMLAAAAAIVLIFGSIGFSRLYPHDTVLDQIYRALQLFGFGGNVNSHPNTWLEIARFLGPFVVGFAAAQAVFALYRDQIQSARLRMLRNHVIVAGLGTAGFTMATAFERDDWHVVVVEQDPLNPALKGCRERGIKVVIGDARDRNILRKAGLTKAILLMVMCGEDGANLDVAASARAVTLGRRRGVLTALVELDDLELWGVIKVQALLDRDGSPFRLELFNSFALAGELLLRQRPPFDPADPGSPHVILFGAHGVAHSVVTEMARQWIAAPHESGDAFRLTLAGPNAESELSGLLAGVSGLDQVKQMELSAWTIDPIACEQVAPADADTNAVYVSLDSETAALKVALTLRQQGDVWGRVPITVAVSDQESGVGAAIRRGGPELEGVSAFGVLRQTLTPLALLRTTTEQLAAFSHRCHVRDRLAQGDDPSDPSLADWDDLADPLRESNRLSADRIPGVLAQLGYQVVTDPLIDLTEPLLQFTEAEVELLAPAEHKGWQEHMRRIGYRPGPVKDHRRKRHPLLEVDYDDLPEDNKEKDRAHVRAIPEVLARAGFRVQRVGAPVNAIARSTYEEVPG